MRVKRVVDVLLGAVLAVLAIPVIVMFALVVWLELRAWPVFFQIRIGSDGVEFLMPKLRTLPVDAAGYAHKDSFSGLELPRFCRFLRESHLDELPQLLLVPLGKMSLVGPRPKMPDWAEPIDPTYGLVRISIRPGCTGLWQIGRHTYLRVSDSPAYDYFYFRNACLRLDLWILWRTVPLLLGIGDGVWLSQVPHWARGRGMPVLDSARDFKEEPPARLITRDGGQPSQRPVYRVSRRSGS